MFRGESSNISDSIELYLEERFTRYGGRLTVYLVITLVKNDKTELELYSFPAFQRLNNLPDAAEKDDENYESMTTLAEIAKKSAEAAVKAKEEINTFVTDYDELENKPKINGVELKKDINTSDLGIAEKETVQGVYKSLSKEKPLDVNV